MNKFKLALASFVSAFVLIAMPASVFAGYAPSDRATFQCASATSCAGANYVTFNSITNAVNYGDERAFFDARDASSNGAYLDNMNVTDGQRITMRVYIHNDANPNAIGVSAATALNTQMLVMLPQGARTSQQAAAQISADNANPRYVNDTVDLNGARPFTLTFDTNAPVMATYRQNGQGPFVTAPIHIANFTNPSTLVANFGDWHGCFEYSAIVTFTAVVSMPTAPVTPTVTTAAATTTKALPNTGPGDVLGIFAGSSAAGAALHYAVRNRRNRD